MVEAFEHFIVVDDGIGPVDHAYKQIMSRIEIPVYLIRFTYNTLRGNSKEQTWAVTGLDEKQAATHLKMYIHDYNNENPYRAYLNVEILSVGFLRNMLIEI